MALCVQSEPLEFIQCGAVRPASELCAFLEQTEERFGSGQLWTHGVGWPPNQKLDTVLVLSILFLC